MSPLFNHIMLLESFDSDSIELITELIETNPELILRKPLIYKYLIDSKNINLLQLLDSKTKDFPNLKELNSHFFDTNRQYSIKYYPNTNEFDLSNIDFPLAIISMSEYKKEVLRKISTDINFFVVLDCSLDSSKGLIHFSVNDSEKATNSGLEKFINNKGLSFALSASLVLGSFIGYKASTKLISENDIKTLSHLNLGSFSKFGDSILALRKLNNPRLNQALNSLDVKELDLLTSLKESPISEIQDQYQDQIVDQISSLIEKTQNERIKFKTQKKVQSEESIKKIAEDLVKNSIDHDIDYRIFTSIIMQESKFDQGEISSSGDVAMAQINYEIWKPEFDKMGIDLDKEKLKKDESYAIWAMGVVLSTIKKRYAEKDPYWYARYHSSTKSRKFEYVGLVNNHFHDFNKYQIDTVLAKIDSILFEIKSIDFSLHPDVDESEIDLLSKKLIQIKLSMESEKISSRIVSR